MPINIFRNSIKFFNTYGNGDDFSLNPSNNISYLRGGAMNRQKVELDINISWEAVADKINTGVSFTLSGNVLSRNTGSFIDDGFSIGDIIDLITVGTLIPIFEDRNITNISDTDIFFDGSGFAAQQIENHVLFGGKTDLFGLEYSFNLVDNDDSATFVSLLDNSDQTFYAAGIGLDSGGGRDTSFVDMLPKNVTTQGQGWDTSSISRVRFVARTSKYEQKFIIEHDFILPYNDESIYIGNSSLKYVGKFDFRVNLANLNTSKVYEFDDLLGNTGFFDENYGGYDNDFNVTELVYTDVNSLATVNELNIKSRTRVNFKLTSQNNFFSVNDPLVIYHSYLPTFNNYNKSPNDYIDTWIYAQHSIIIDGLTTSSGIIYNASADFVSSSEVNVEFEIEFTNDQQAILEEGLPYRLACEVGDGLNQIRNVTLNVDLDTYSEDDNITGLIISDEFGFNPYWKFIFPENLLFTVYKGWNEDEFVSYHRFGVNRSVSKDAKILGASAKLIAFNNTTGDYFELQNENLDLSNQISAPVNTVNSNPFEIQLINDSRTRGYNLPNGDEFNLLLFETYDNDGTYQFYEWRVGFKINWQYWISLPNADTVFINTSDEFNGLNNRTSNYSMNKDYSIRVLWEFEMEGLNDDGEKGQTTYEFISQEFDIFDFDEQDNDPTTWDCEIVTDFNDSIDIDAPTKVTATFTPQPPYIISDPSVWWGEVRIEETQQPSFLNDVITTTKPIANNNRLIPLTGETQLKKTLVSNTLVFECLIDNSKILNTNYNLTGRLANMDEPIPPATWIFQTEIDVPTDGAFTGRFGSVGGEVVTWTLTDGYNETNNNISKADRLGLTSNELNGTCQDVLVTFSTNNPNNITEIDLSNNIENSRVCGDIDLTQFNNLSSISFNLTNFDSIVFGTSMTTLINFYANGISNVQTVDFTPFGAFFGGDVQMSNCPSLTSVSFPTSSLPFTRLSMSNNNLLNTVDLSDLTGLSDDIRFDRNTNLDTIIFPISSGNIFRLQLDQNNLSFLNLSTLSNINGRVNAVLNNLTSIQFHPNTQFGIGTSVNTGCALGFNDLTTVDFSIFTNNLSNSDIRLNNNNIPTSEVNKILADMVTQASTNGWINVELRLQSQTPLAPPTGQGLIDKNTLINVYGWTVITD